MKSCTTSIKNNISQLSEKERSIANYVLENAQEVLKLNVTELADRTNSSDATVIRFCRSVGFKGYQAFKIALAQDLVNPNKLYNTSLDISDDTETVVSKIFKAEIEALEDTLANIDHAVLDNVVKTISDKRKLYLFGGGGSAYVALDATHKFLKIGIECIFNLDNDTQLMTASLTKSDDVVLAISHSGSNKGTINCIKNAKDNGAVIIGLSTFGKSPMDRYCDYMLHVSTQETIFKSESVTARIAYLAVIDSIVAALAISNYEKSSIAINKTRIATADKKY